MQAPREEARLPYRVVVWQSALVEGGQQQNVRISARTSHESARPIANRPQVDNLPYIKTKISRPVSTA
jgi:hypothetical protein